MTARRIIIGGLMASVILLPQAARGAMPLYERMKQAVEQEMAREESDEIVVPFLRLVFEERWKLDDDDIRGILKGEEARVCTEASPEKPIQNVLSCFEIKSRVQELATFENRIRSLGRTLQATATSYELPISDLPGRSLKLAADLRAIVNIWSAGTGSVKVDIEAPLIRTVTADPDVFRTLLTDIGEELETMDDEQRTAAVWRYQYGVRLLRSEREPRYPAPVTPPDSGPGTERQYQFKRWDNVEEMLMAVWDEIENDELDPPLSSQETAYYTFSTELFDETLPDNVIVWARLDADSSEGHLVGDVGLQWAVPIEPVLPSLTHEEEDEPILGGEYPPEPVLEDKEGEEGEDPEPADGRGLCTNPVAERGYLCRPFTATLPGERCPDSSTPGDDGIGLVHCTSTGSLRYTAAGADVCRDIAWQEAQPFDPQTQCRVTLTCNTSCEGGGSAQSINKNGEGIIDTCIANEPEVPATYLIFHELVHAYQKCNKPIGYDPYEGLDEAQKSAACCQIEGEAYRAQCDMMERDGVFHDEEGNPLLSNEGIPFNAETCMEALTNLSCGPRDGYKGCYTSRTYSQEFIDQLVAAENNNPKDVPVSCADATDPEQMDDRVAQLLDAIETHDDVCKPGEVNIYKNRIGNNACYIGQCVEMSTELHRITAGRTPAGVQDQIAPWDDPQTATPLGNVLTDPPVTQARLPSYRPETFVRELETALCQLQGLPPRTPPILCAIDARRQLELARTFGAQTAEGLLAQGNEQALSTDDLLSIARGVGARLGTNLYGSYLRESNRSFAGILGMASELLEELEKIDFPTEMCPISPGMPPPVNPD